VSSRPRTYAREVRHKLERVRRWVHDRIALPLLYLAWWPWRRHLKAENTILLALYFTSVRWLAAWGVVWAVQWWLIPTWLVGSRTGLQTAFQVIPAVIVAVFVLVLGSVLVIAQQMVSAYGNRAPLLLPQDLEIGQLVARPLLVTIAALLLAGQVPDADEPAEALTAAAATLALMAVSIIRTAAPALPALFFGYSAPINFSNKVLEGVEDYMRDGATDMVKYRVAIFEDMLRAGIRRGDSKAIGGAVTGLRGFLDAYMAASNDNPDARTFVYENDGHEEKGWFGSDLADTLRNGAEDSMSNVTSENDMDLVGRALGEFAVVFVKAGYDEEAKYMIDALLQTGVSVHQIVPSGAINLFIKSTDGLVRAERTAEEVGNGDLAARALVAWAVVTAYQYIHFELEHPPRFEVDVAGMGPRPPWYPAGALITEREFINRWHNKLPRGEEPPLAWLQWGREEHDKQHEGGG
jgi:hypothetical protein